MRAPERLPTRPPRMYNGVDLEFIHEATRVTYDEIIAFIDSHPEQSRAEVLRHMCMLRHGVVVDYVE